MELKKVQELTSVDQDTLFLLFLDIIKAYDTLYRGRLMASSIFKRSVIG